MADRLRVRMVPGPVSCCRTDDGYALFACSRAFYRVAVIRPNSQVPLEYFKTFAAAADFVVADRAARAVR